MVPPEGIDKVAPTTLPADFGEWDTGEAQETHPADFKGFDRFPAPAPAPPAPPPPPAPPKAAQRVAPTRVAVLPAAERPPVAPPPPPRKAVKRYQAPEPVIELPHSKDLDVDDSEQEDESKSKRMKMLAAGGVVLLVIVAGTVGYLKSGSKPATANQPVAQQTATTSPNGEAPSQTATAPTQSTPQQNNTAPAQTPEPQQGVSGKQSEMMKSQLNAPSKISNDLKALGANQQAPAGGFNPAGMDMGGSSPVFNSGNGPKVKVEAPRKLTILNGIAVGLLVQKTPPVYPAIAKSARVSGTVVIQATISKTGVIENSRAISGPQMLRQAALDAVKTWRFRPYLLDGQPVEVDTSVNVVFNLGN